MKDKKFLYLLILILLTAAVLFSGQKGFLFQVILSAFGIAWAIIVVLIIMLFMNQASDKKIPDHNVFVRIKDIKKYEMEIFESGRNGKIYFSGGSNKSGIVHFLGERATEKNVQDFLHKIGIKEFEILK